MQLNQQAEQFCTHRASKRSKVHDLNLLSFPLELGEGLDCMLCVCRMVLEPLQNQRPLLATNSVAAALILSVVGGSD